MLSVFCYFPFVLRPLAGGKSKHVFDVVRTPQYYSRARDNLVLAPFGVATSVAMMLEGLQGRAAEEVTALFRLQAKEARQQLRRGFKTIFDTFGVRLAENQNCNSTVYYNIIFMHAIDTVCKIQRINLSSCWNKRSLYNFIIICDILKLLYV